MLIGVAPAPVPSNVAPSRRRMVIQEVEDDSDESESEDVFTDSNATRQPSSDALVMLNHLKESAKQCYQLGQYSEALNIYSEAIGMLDERTDVILALTLYNNRAACFLKLGDLHECQTDCEFVLSKDPENIKAMLRRAAVYEQKEKYTDALRDYRKILAFAPSTSAAQDGCTRVVKCMKSLGIKIAPDPRRTVSIKAASTKRIEEQYTNLKDKGNSLFKQQKYSEAVEMYTQCIELDHSNTSAFNNRAMAWLRLGMPNKAILDASRVLDFEPANVKALFRRAQAFEQMNKLSEAQQDLTTILHFEPDNIAARNELKSLNDRLARTQEPRKISIEEVETDTGSDSENEPAETVPTLRQTQNQVTLDLSIVDSPDRLL